LGQATGLSAERCRKARSQLGGDSPRDTILNEPTGTSKLAALETMKFPCDILAILYPTFSPLCSSPSLNCPVYTGGQQARVRQVLTPPGGAAESNWVKPPEIR